MAREGGQASEHGHDDAHGLSALEMERLQLMARNRARLMALGIPVAVLELKDLAQHRREAEARQRTKPRAARHAPQEQQLQPTRRSTRHRGGEAGQGEGGEGGGAAPQLLQLGPDGQVEEQGGAGAGAGAARRRGAEEPPEGLTEEEIAARAESMRAREASRLRELELEGLVDLTEEQAVFVVIGSTGTHYTVRLSDARRVCNCMDCRIRKRDCKHIRLLLAKLLIEEDPKQWHQAVERIFLRGSGGAEGIQHGGAAAGVAAAGETEGASEGHGEKREGGEGAAQAEEHASAEEEVEEEQQEQHATAGAKKGGRRAGGKGAGGRKRGGGAGGGGAADGAGQEGEGIGSKPKRKKR